MTGKLAVRQSGAAMARNLARTLERAERYGTERGHGELTLEHLLMSFTEDPDTLRSFKACGVSLDLLRDELAASLAGLPARPGEYAGPVHSAELTRLMADATDATLEANRAEINSFIVLAALVGNEQSDAARVLQRHGFTWEKAIQALQSPAAAARKAVEAEPSRAPAPVSPEKAAPPLEEAETTTSPWPEPEEPEPPIVAEDEPGARNNKEEDARQQGGHFAPPSQAPEPKGLDEPRFAAEPRPNSSPSPEKVKPAGKATATPDDIMASVRQKLGTKPAAAKKVLPSLDLPLAPKWQSVNQKPAVPDQSRPPAADARAPVDIEPEPSAHFPPTPALPPEPGPASPPPARPASQALRSPRPPFSTGIRPTTLEALAAEAARAARGRAEAAQPPWPAPPGQAPPTLDTRAQPHSRRLVDLASERHRPLDDALVEAPPQPLAPLRPAPRPVEVNLAALMSVWPRSLAERRQADVGIELRRADLEALIARASGTSDGPDFAAGAITLRLKAEGGGVSIEPQSPETQWVENTQGLVDDGMVGWRWTMSPQVKGRKTLRLIASIRTLAADGSTRDTGLDDGRLQVRVRGRGRAMLGWIGWTLAAILGGLEVYEGFTGTDPILKLISSLGGMLFGG